MTDELGQKITEFLKRAVEKVRSMFGQEAKPEQRSSAGPNMGAAVTGAILGRITRTVPAETRRI